MRQISRAAASTRAVPATRLRPGIALRPCLHVSKAASVETGSEVATPSEVLVKISVPFKTTYGKIVKAVGGTRKLGEWDAKAAPPLHWSEGDVWVGEVALPPGAYEFKVVVWDTQNARAEWEGCRNRLLQVPAFPGTLEASCLWSRSEMDTHFTDAPQAGAGSDLLESAAQRAAQVNGHSSEEAAQLAEGALEEARRSIQDTVAQLMSEDEGLGGLHNLPGTHAGLGDPASQAEYEHAPDTPPTSPTNAIPHLEPAEPLDLKAAAEQATAALNASQAQAAGGDGVLSAAEAAAVDSLMETAAETAAEGGDGWDSDGPREEEDSIVAAAVAAETDEEPFEAPMPAVSGLGGEGEGMTPIEAEEEVLAAGLAAALLEDVKTEPLKPTADAVAEEETPEVTPHTTAMVNLPPTPSDAAAADLTGVTAVVEPPPITSAAPPATESVEEGSPAPPATPQAKPRRAPKGLRGFFDMLKGKH